MKKRCFFIVLLFASAYCAPKEERIAELVRMEVIDSLRISTETHYITGQSDTKMVNDSLIAVSSHYNSGIWLINNKSGKVEAAIESKKNMDIAFMAAGIDFSEFPKVSILDGLSSRILIFDAFDKEYFKSIVLDIPSEKRIKPYQSVFYRTHDGYFVELYHQRESHNSMDFYKNSKYLLGRYNEEGGLVDTFMDYPPELKHLSQNIMPYKYFAFNKQNTNFIYSFPSTGRVEILKSDHSESVLSLELPEKSRFFNFELAYLNGRFDPNIQNRTKQPRSHYFENIIETDSAVFIQSMMRDNSNLDEWVMKSHVFKYDKNKGIWFESDKPQLYSNLGRLTAAKGDTLLFYEGSLTSGNEIYIKKILMN
jgi:hypothetical protein